jgi:hypothetical protein
VTDDLRERFRQRGALWPWITVTGAKLVFVRFTGGVAAEISALAAMRRLETGRKRGWGSLPVEARIGETRWRTSIFPGDEATWLLPIKRAVRDAEALVEGDQADVEIGL